MVEERIAAVMTELAESNIKFTEQFFGDESSGRRSPVMPTGPRTG